jgi:putative ABC transport system ATP-binding protein
MTSDSSAKIGTEDCAVLLENVKKDYRVPGRKEPIKALQGISAAFEKGSMIAICGPSGSGKTTLLQIIGALDLATSGKTIVNGIELSKMSGKELTEHRAKTIGFVFQTFNLIPNLTVFENVELPMEALNVPKDKRRQRVDELLESVDMKPRADYKPLKLSGGEQQRVAIARALANTPQIILADEPTGNLDTKTGHSIMNLLDKLRREMGTTIIIVTHSNNVAKKCDFTLQIQDGVIISNKNMAAEENERNRKNTLRSELAITDKMINKLFSAGYDSLEMLAGASLEELTKVTGDATIARRIAKKSAILSERAVKYNKQLLAVDLALSDAIVDKLYNAGFKTLPSIATASMNDLTAALGDKELAKEIFEKADIMVAKPEDEDE